MIGKFKRVFNGSAFNKVGIFSISLFVAATAAYVFTPIIGSYAEESNKPQVSVGIGKVISISTSLENLAFEANVGDFVHGPININVSTNSQYGYTLTLEDTDDESSLIHANSTVVDKLTSDFEGTKTSSTMLDNTWGFSLNGMDYYYIPTIGNPVKLAATTVAVTNNYDTTVVDFGMKAGPNLTAGTYSDSVKFTVYANGVDGLPEDGTATSNPGKVVKKGIHSIANMQDMTPEVCAETTTPLVTNAATTKYDWDGSHYGDASYVPRTKLTDIRDDKTYLVSKLADGNCWMSQSLELDLVSGVAIEVSNNDGTTSSVIPANTTQTVANKKWEESSNTWRSYKPQADEAYYQNGLTKASEPSAPGVEYDWERAGNYYNWYTATAGTGTSSMDRMEEAQSSICPKGWRLPTVVSRTYSLPNDKIYKYLISTIYMLPMGVEGAIAFRSDPLNFNASGYYSYYNGVMATQGIQGRYWSSVAYSSTYAYHSGFNTSSSGGYSSENSWVKGFGFSVRCVAI